MSKPPNRSSRSIPKPRSKPASLIELKKANLHRWNTVKTLHDQLHQRIAGSEKTEKKNYQENGSRGKACTFETLMENEELLLKAEMALLGQKPDDACEHCTENAVKRGVEDTRNRATQMFGREISSSFCGLKQVNAVLNEELKECVGSVTHINVKNEIEEVNNVLDTNTKVNAALHSMLKEQELGRESMIKRDESDKNDIHSQMMAASQYQDWIKNEISYLSNRVYINRKRILKSDRNSVPKGPLVKKSKRTPQTISKSRAFVPISNQIDAKSFPLDEGKQWEISRFLDTLIQKLLSSPMDPYMEFNKFITRDMIDFLVSCDIVEYHQSNESLFRLKNISL